MKIEHIAMYVNDLENAKNILEQNQMMASIIQKQISNLIFCPLMTEPGWKL